MINGPATIPPTDPPTLEPGAVVVVPGAPPAPAPGEARYVTCDFCECVLVRTGEIFRMGARARQYRDRAERETAQTAELESLRSQLQTARNSLAEAERMLREDAERSGTRSNDRI